MSDFDNPAFESNLDDLDDDEPESDDFQTPLLSDFDGTTLNLQQELLQNSVDDFYKQIGERDGLFPNARDYKRFKVLQNGALAYIKDDGKETQVTNAINSEPLRPSTLRSRIGVRGMREGLGFVDYASARSGKRENAVAALQDVSTELGAAARDAETVELQELSNVADNAVQTLTTRLTDDEIDEILGTMEDSPLNLRELRGLDRVLQNIRGELTNNLAKLTELDNHITQEKRKLGEAEDEFSRRRVAERLRNLEEERSARLEAASASREALRTQINRIRETVNRILNENTTLAERLRTLFREQGVTIASIITALGFIVSTIVLAVTGGGTPVPVPQPTPPDKDGIRDWAKKRLQALASILAKLATKAAAALPGIIASVVSWLLNFLAKGAGWLADNLWASVIALGSILFLYVSRAT